MFEKLHLTSHHDERRGKPVVIKDLTIRTYEGQVEPNWRSWSQVSGSETNVADESVSGYLQGLNVSHLDLVEEMRIRRLRVDGQHPAVLVTAKPRVVQVLRGWW